MPAERGDMVEVIAVVAIVAVCVVLLAVRLFAGRDFVQTHLDRNEAMRRRGIGCAKNEGDYIERRSGLKIEEHSSNKR